ncbi:MAG: DUF4296 domain-containing protein [Ferruginibacter sp.]
MKGFIVTIALLCLMGCAGKDASKGLLGKDKMQVVLWDLIQADAFTEQFIKRDTSKNPVLENVQLQNKIFAIHKVSKEEFYKSYDYYVSKTELMSAMLDSMTIQAERNRSKMLEKQHSAPTTADSASVNARIKYHKQGRSY